MKTGPVERGCAAVAIAVAKAVVHVECNPVSVLFGSRDKVRAPTQQLDGALGLSGFGDGVLHLLRHCLCCLLCGMADKKKYSDDTIVCQEKLLC